MRLRTIRKLALSHQAGKRESPHSNSSLAHCRNFALNPRWDERQKQKWGLWKGGGHFPYPKTVLGQEEKTGGGLKEP